MRNCILCFLVFLMTIITGCKDDHDCKTQGEITGEVIVELIKLEGYPAMCRIDDFSFYDNLPFTVEGQFLHVEKDGRTYRFNLNRLSHWYIESDYFFFYFEC